jgi:hypothetical protein
MPASVKQRRKRKTPTQQLAAALGGLLAVLTLAATAQTNAPVVVTPPVAEASAVAPQTNVISQAETAAPVSTNAVSLVEMLQNDAAFQTYTNLLEHSLFVPASEIGGVGGSDTGLTFAGGLRLTGLIVRGGIVEASIEDRNDPDKRMFVKADDVIEGTEIKVVGFDLRNRAVLLKKGDEEGRLEYEMEAMPAPASTTGKPGVAGMPGMPPPQGAMMPRPGMPPSLQPGMAAGVRSSGGGPRLAPSPTSSSSAANSAGSASQPTSRREQRQQQIARLQQVLKSTPDPAARQRLQNYIQMLEKANTQD